MDLREQFQKETGKSVFSEDYIKWLEHTTEEDSQSVEQEFSEDYVEWLENKIENEEYSNGQSIEQEILTLSDKEGVESLVEFCKNLSCNGYVFSWHKYISDEVIESINEHEVFIMLERYGVLNYKVVKRPAFPPLPEGTVLKLNEMFPWFFK